MSYDTNVYVGHYACVRVTKDARTIHWNIEDAEGDDAAALKDCHVIFPEFLSTTELFVMLPGYAKLMDVCRSDPCVVNINDNPLTIEQSTEIRKALERVYESTDVSFGYGMISETC